MNAQEQEINLELLLESQTIEAINSVFCALSSKKTLTPSEHTSALFSYLVRLSLSNNSYHKEVVEKLGQDGTLQKLIELCCIGEIELEKYWARRIIKGENDITGFPYYGNYRQLTTYELDVMGKHANLDGKKIFFAGSGAIPFTPIMFKEHQPSLEIRCIDKDEECVDYSNMLLSRLGLNNPYITHNDINDLNNEMRSEISNSGIVFIAALVGNSNLQKNKILSNIHDYTRTGSLVAVRSVPDDMRRLMYPKFELEDGLKVGYKVLGEYSLPKETGVINSIVVMKRV